METASRGRLDAHDVMTSRHLRIAALLTLALAPALLAPPARATSLFGREFWLAWPRTPDVRDEDPRQDVDAELIVLAADRAVTVRVTAPGVDRVVSAAPGAPASVRLPRASVMVTAEDAPVAQAIHVAPEAASCGLFAALLRVPGSGYSIGDDVTRALPVDLCGQRYVAASYWGKSELVVTATEDGTTVTIDDYTCGARGPFTLSRGQALMHRCVRAPGDGSVAGALVTASAPLSVISGSEESAIVSHEGAQPTQRGYWGWFDVLLEAPWPIDLLGREHAHGPFRKGSATASGDLIRMIAACDDTSVRVSEDAGTRSWHLTAAGDVRDVETPDVFAGTWRLVPGAATITSNRGVLVASCTVGQSNAGIGDPSLSLLDPRDRWEPAAVAWLPQGYEHSLTIVADAASVASVRLDGAAVAGTWAPVPGSSLQWTRLDLVAAGEHRVTAGAPIFVECAGYAPGGVAGAYSYPAIPLASDAGGAIGGLRIAGGDACATTCPGACTTLRAPQGFSSWRWSTGATGSQTTECPQATTTISLTATDAGGCRFAGSATLFVIDAPSSPAIDGPSSACAGACVELSAPAGYDTYAWSSGESTRAITACPSADTTYRVTVSAAAGCGGSADHLVTVYPAPVPGDAVASHPNPCVRGIDVTWLEAAWRPGSPGGTYNVYRRTGGCVATDDPSWQLMAIELTAPPWRDATAQSGVTYAYMIEAEDAAAPGACAPGPGHGGPTGRRCARPLAGIQDPGDPDEARLVSFSPHLRAQSYERVGTDGPATAVTFHWPTLPALDPATHVEAWRGTDPRALVRVDPLVTTPQWRDPRAGDAWLLFYKIFNATDCGTLGD